MKHQDGNYQNSKGQSIYYQSWTPEGKVKATVLIVHGLHEHSNRYQHLAAFLSEHGYAVYGMDLPGHGRSVGLRSYVDELQDFFDPLDFCLDLIHEQQPGLPIYLLGHSMGGGIGASYLTKKQAQFQGAVFSGPLVMVPDYVSDFTLKVGKILSDILPKVRILAIDAQGVSRDPAVVEAYINDPLVYTGKVTARLSNEINQAIALIEKDGATIDIPLLLLHGGADSLCNPAYSEYLHDKVSSQDKKLIIYDGLYHEIFNEPEKKDVFSDLLQWLEEHSN